MTLWKRIEWDWVVFILVITLIPAVFVIHAIEHQRYTQKYKQVIMNSTPYCFLPSVQNQFWSTWNREYTFAGGSNVVRSDDIKKIFETNGIDVNKVQFSYHRISSDMDACLVQFDHIIGVGKESFSVPFTVTKFVTEKGTEIYYVTLDK